MAGLAQKGGAVFSHIRIAERPEDIHAIRVGARGADLVIGGDIVVAGNKKVLSAVKPGNTAMVVNLSETLPGEFTRKPEFSLPIERLKRAISTVAGREHSHFVEASRIATALLGQSIGANLFILGYAYQTGALPLSAQAVEKAIELNGEAVAMNVAAFRWGRRAVVDPAGVQALLVPPEAEDPAQRISRSFDEMVARRVEFLTAYQDATYAARYREWVHQAKAIEAAKAPGKCGLADAVGRYLFKLMAYKDEYEVARLYADPAFLKQVYGTFDGDRLRLRFHLAPPLLALRNKSTGLPRKMTFGPWMLGVFKFLARLKFLRGSLFDPFGHTRERRTERKLISDYEAMLETLLAKLTAENHHIAVGLASVPEKIRGYGHVKMRHLEAAKSEEAALLEQFGASPSPVLKAAE
jgi:indolepyruvate ferredoxin oxidoreductase